MASHIMQIDIVSAEQLIFSGEASFAVFPGEMGELGIFPRHAPLLALIKPGSIRLHVPGTEELESIYVSGGILEVQPTLITLLTDTAVRADDLDEAKAIEAQKQAREKLKGRESGVDFAKAEAELAQAVAQIRAIKTRKRRLPITH
ncbi:MAG: F0F1 ATP synthase subunit epsilon [Candidatus Accumulibacter sp.]|jgi:F-type H+-transporting ATPase subunit epsilon|nr:F0F1 ATP synthase subunit epsilon [Accumulibacter sp.]